VGGIDFGVVCVCLDVCVLEGGICPAEPCGGQDLHENLIIDTRGENSQLSLFLL
jgi:hypothetical protein